MRVLTSMFSFFKRSIGAKLGRWFLWISLLPALTIGYLSYSKAYESLKETIIHRLTLAVVEKESRLVNLAHSYKSQVEIFAANQILQTLLTDLNREQEGKPVDRRKLKEEIEFFLAVEAEELHRAGGFRRSLIIGKGGQVFIDSLGSDTGKDYSRREIFRRGSEKPFVEYHIDSQGRPYLIVAGPVFPHSIIHEEEIGVFVLEADMDETKKVLSNSEKGGEVTFLLNHQGRILLDSSMGAIPPPSPDLRAEREGNGWREEAGRLMTYRSIEEIGGGALLVWVDEKEAFAPIHQLRNRLILIILITGGAASLVSSLVSRSLIKPIQTLYKGVEEISSGHLDARVRVETGDEIEGLAHRFNQMAEHLRERTGELFSEKERLDVTLRAIGDGVITSDTEGRLTLINKAAEALTGWSQQEGIGKPIAEVFNLMDERGRKRCEDPVERVLRTGQAATLAEQTVLIAREGAERKIDGSASPIYDEKGELTGAVLVFRDITEKEKMKEEIQKVQKLESIGLLAGGIAHDFNNILTAILGNVSLAKMRVPSEPKAVKYLSEAEKASQRAKDLTYQLLTFTRGGVPILKITSIPDLIRDSAGFALRGSNIRCELTIPEDLWLVEIDAGQISQVIHNIVLNARQAMPEGGVVGIRARNIELKKGEGPPLPLPEGKYVEISIRDQGVGIPAEHLPKIFDPYFTTKKKGTGLGLTSSHAIIEKHGGHIAVESKPGSGTTFSIYLPATEKRMAPEEKPEEGSISGRGERILVMDDEDAVREVAREILTRFGYEVGSAAEGAEAIEMYIKAKEQGRPFDLVITDMTVPGGMGGKELVCRLLELDPHVKVIVCSGYSSDLILSNLREYGFAGAVTKPYRAEELSQTVHRVLHDSV